MNQQPATGSDLQLSAISDWSTLYRLTQSVDYLQRCAHYLPHLVDFDPLFNELFVNLDTALCNHREDRLAINQIRQQLVAPVYGCWIARWHRLLQSQLGWPPCALRHPASKRSSASGVRRILFVARQILAPAHSPTRVCVDIGYGLQQRGIELLVINSNSFPGTNQLRFSGGLIANLSHHYVGSQLVNFGDDTKLPMVSVDRHGVDLEKLLRLLTAAQDFGPDLVLSHGTGNIVGDLLAKHYPTISLPTADMPPMTAAPIVVDFLNSFDELNWPRVSDASPKLRSLPNAIRTRSPKRSISRIELNIGPDHIVYVIVGNRLDDDMSADFENLLNAIVQAVPQALLLMVGQKKHPWKSTAGERLDRVVRFLPYESDLPALFSISDVYLNPPRRGGGISCLIALQQGLPCVSYPGGDAGRLLDGTCVQESPIAYAEQAISLGIHSRYRARARQQSAELVAKIPSFEQMIDKLLNLGLEALRCGPIQSPPSPATPSPMDNSSTE